MNYTSRKFGIIRRRYGFTLVELIVVLVIIGILLALVIPNLTGYIDKAQATSCRKNRAELEKIYRYDTLLAEAEGTATTMSAVLGSENGKKLTCPSDGTYTYNEATGRLICSISAHNAGIVSTNPIAGGVLNYLPNGVGKINSGATKGVYTGAFLQNLTDAGIDLNKMNINSWSYDNNTGVFYWTSAYISQLNEGDDVIVFKYNTKDAELNKDGVRVYFKDTYSVWKMKVAYPSKTDTSYKIIGGVIDEMSSDKYSADSAEKKDFDIINKLYESEMEEYYKLHPEAKIKPTT